MLFTQGLQYPESSHVCSYSSTLDDGHFVVFDWGMHNKSKPRWYVHRARVKQKPDLLGRGNPGIKSSSLGGMWRLLAGFKGLLRTHLLLLCKTRRRWRLGHLMIATITPPEGCRTVAVNLHVLE